MTSRLYRFGARQYPQHPQHRNIDDHGRAELVKRNASQKKCNDSQVASHQASFLLID
jgi:hypothetical protein